MADADYNADDNNITGSTSSAGRWKKREEGVFLLEGEDDRKRESAVWRGVHQVMRWINIKTKRVFVKGCLGTVVNEPLNVTEYTNWRADDQVT